MKRFQQVGTGFEEMRDTSGNVCECCQSFDHAAREYLTHDLPCPTCGGLCCCACHADGTPA